MALGILHAAIDLVYKLTSFQGPPEAVCFYLEEPRVYLYILPQGYIHSAICHNIVCNDLNHWVCMSLIYHQVELYTRD